MFHNIPQLTPYLFCIPSTVLHCIITMCFDAFYWKFIVRKSLVLFIFIQFVTQTFFLPLSDNSVNQIFPSVDNVPWATLVMAFLTLLPPVRDCYSYFTCYTYVILI